MLVEKGDVLLLIDKHAAHERIIFEGLKASLHKAEHTSQILMLPIEVMLASDEVMVIDQYRAELGAKMCIRDRSGNEARVCDYDWVLGIRDACIAAKTEFVFRQTGARLKKDGRIYEIPRKYQFEMCIRDRL